MGSAAGGEVGSGPDIPVQRSGISVAREWAVEGRGISDLRGRLELLLPEWRCPDLPLNALFQRNRYMAPRVRVLLHFLGERIALAFAELERSRVHTFAAGCIYVPGSCLGERDSGTPPWHSFLFARHAIT